MTQILRVGQLSPAFQIDPTVAQDIESMFAVHQIFQSPFSVDLATTNVTPELMAEMLEEIPGGELPRYRAAVRRDRCFSDGTPLTAEHVAASLQHSEALRHLATSVVVDGDSLVFTSQQANSRLDLTLSHGQCGVVLRQGNRLLGTGPFVLADDSRPEHVRLCRNPHWTEALDIDEIHFITYPPDSDGRPTALRRALERGDVDLTTSLPRDEIGLLSGVRKSIMPGVSTAILWMNLESPRLQDRRHRQAIARAIDRYTAAKISFSNALAFAAASPLPRPLGAADDELVYNPRQAEELLAAAGPIREPLKLLLIWGPRHYIPHPRPLAEEIARQLALVGIRVDIVQTKDPTDLYDAFFANRYDMYLGGWSADTQDPCDFLDSLLATNGIPSPGNLTVSANYGQLRSPAMDRALATYRARRSAEALQEVLSLHAEEAPLVPIMYGAAAQVSSFAVTNLPPTPLSAFPLAGVRLNRLGDSMSSLAM